jgi:hypothetical protein
MDARENRLVRLDVPAAGSSFAKSSPSVQDLIAGNQNCLKPILRQEHFGIRLTR